MRMGATIGRPSARMATGRVAPSRVGVVTMSPAQPASTKVVAKTIEEAIVRFRRYAAAERTRWHRLKWQLDVVAAVVDAVQDFLIAAGDVFRFDDDERRAELHHPLGVLRRLVQVHDDGVERILRVDFETDGAGQPFERADIAKARAVGDRLDVLHDQRDDARFCLKSRGEDETNGDCEPFESLVHWDTPLRRVR